MANYQLRARDIMQIEIATILPDLTGEAAAFLMRHYGVRGLIVEKDSDDDAEDVPPNRPERRVRSLPAPARKRPASLRLKIFGES